MSFVPGFDNDVFISYAHADNISDASGIGWVTQFAQHIREALIQRLGGHDGLKVYFDNSDLRSNQEITQLEKEIRSSATFIAVSSRSYVQREWTMRELNTFLERGSTTNDLFTIECLPLDNDGEYPHALQSRKRLSFWHHDQPDSSIPMPILAVLHPLLYYRRIHDLAEQIRIRLIELSHTQASKPIGTPAPTSTSTGEISDASSTVLLAQTTDDLEEERHQVYLYLKQAGLNVLPADGYYPQGGEQFMGSFKQDLEQADIFVQLLGRTAGRRPPDLPQGYNSYQSDAAVDNGVEIMQWRHPDIDPETVENEGQRTLLTRETTIAGGLESFKADIVKRLENNNKPQTEKKPNLLFINADRDDLDVAQALHDELEKDNIPVILPSFSGTAEDVRLDLRENLMDCDALVFIYGEAPSIWVRRHLKLFNKLRVERDEEVKILALYKSPPAEKSEINISLPGLEVIDCSTGDDPSPLKKLLEGSH